MLSKFNQKKNFRLNRSSFGTDFKNSKLGLCDKFFARLVNQPKSNHEVRNIPKEIVANPHFSHNSGTVDAINSGLLDFCNVDLRQGPKFYLSLDSCDREICLTFVDIRRQNRNFMTFCLLQENVNFIGIIDFEID